jgi:hypothetical protein
MTWQAIFSRPKRQEDGTRETLESFFQSLGGAVQVASIKTRVATTPGFSA